MQCPAPLESTCGQAPVMLAGDSGGRSTHVADIAASWNEMIPIPNEMKICRLSSSIPSTARSMEPLGPRSASPGPEAASAGKSQGLRDEGRRRTPDGYKSRVANAVQLGSQCYHRREEEHKLHTTEAGCSTHSGTSQAYHNAPCMVLVCHRAR